VPVSAVLLILAVIVFAACIVTHIALVWRVIWHEKTTHRQRLFAIVVPIVTPIFAWRLDQRRHVVTWGVLIALYGVLRLVIGVR
jgi:hypothetical protein